MTRDERAAISILNAYKVGYESGMEDLEQEPCDDLISREAVIEWLKDKDIIKLKSQEERARQELNELPSVTQKPIECDDATNGDAIKAIFPYGKYSEYFADVEMKTEENDTRFKSVFDRDWWDEPYQKGGTNEKQV